MTRAWKWADYLVIGSGIVGVNVATVLKERFPSARIHILEKEAFFGKHGSGRNSGVLHSGVYYAEGSLKAQLTAKGNRFLTSYIERKGLHLNNCGKLIVARKGYPADQRGLDVILERAAKNGVPAQEITAERAKELEPLATTAGRAIWSPSTSAADPLEVLTSQLEDVHRMGITIQYNATVQSIREVGSSATSSLHCEARLADGTVVAAQHVINCAGLHADKLAHQLGFAPGLQILPFKGLYLHCTLPLRRLVYPVPDLGQPFLGVHFTVTADGSCKIGPTAIPAFGREQYGDAGGLQGFLEGLGGEEARRILWLQARMFLFQPSFRSLALKEVAKYDRHRMIAGAAELVPTATMDTFTTYGRAGIRAQLVRTADLALVQDFVLVGDAQSTHVLNAVSPGWTCSRPFAEMVVDGIREGTIRRRSPHENRAFGR